MSAVRSPMACATNSRPGINKGDDDSLIFQALVPEGGTKRQCLPPRRGEAFTDRIAWDHAGWRALSSELEEPS